MLARFAEIQSGSQLAADVCIIGGGPAGITIARELTGTGLSVLLVESGGLEFDKETQNLYRGVNERGDFSLHKSRFRLFGGTSYVWGGWCAPLDEQDFESRPWVPNSGWPISKEDIDPFYRRAQSLFEIDRYRYQVEEWDFGSTPVFSLDPDKLAHRMWQISPPTEFGPVYVDQLRKSENVRVLLYANVTKVSVDPDGSSISGVTLRDLNGREARVSAAAYVLACGGIETTRLLLTSGQEAPGGLGNTEGLVGRYFMEHPHPDAGGVIFTTAAEDFRPYYEKEFESRNIVVGLGPSADAQRRLGILNCSVAFHGPLYHEPSAGMDSALKLSRALEHWQWPDNAGAHIATVLRDLDDVLRESYLRATDGKIRGFGLIARTEVAPNPDNRITLTSDRDELGMPRVRLDWSVGELERVTVEETVNLVAQEFGRLGVGRVQINQLLLENDDRWSRNLSWFGHHMGTTRMSDSPGQGVVDTNCKVFGTSNLYVASSSVFPTCGYANPTLTIAALAIRLADHLKVLAKSDRLRES
ncbi:MAG: GMC family oxidoreductase [Gammaproteobacteria bacterium]|nr:MAG: GMC family oxidoreductase [Gammaproteobacteria bacterium]